MQSSGTKTVNRGESTLGKCPLGKLQRQALFRLRLNGWRDRARIAGPWSRSSSSPFIRCPCPPSAPPRRCRISRRCGACASRAWRTCRERIKHRFSTGETECAGRRRARTALRAVRCALAFTAKPWHTSASTRSTKNSGRRGVFAAHGVNQAAISISSPSVDAFDAVSSKLPWIAAAIA